MSLSEPASKQDLQDAKQQILDQLTETIRSIETHLLTEFHSYAKGQAHHLHSLDTVSSDVMARVALLENRILELEGRIRAK